MRHMWKHENSDKRQQKEPFDEPKFGSRFCNIDPAKACDEAGNRG